MTEMPGWEGWKCATTSKAKKGGTKCQHLLPWKPRSAAASESISSSSAAAAAACPLCPASAPLCPRATMPAQVPADVKVDAAASGVLSRSRLSNQIWFTCAWMSGDKWSICSGSFPSSYTNHFRWWNNAARQCPLENLVPMWNATAMTRYVFQPTWLSAVKCGSWSKPSRKSTLCRHLRLCGGKLRSIAKQHTSEASTSDLQRPEASCQKLIKSVRLQCSNVESYNDKLMGCRAWPFSSSSHVPLKHSIRAGCGTQALFTNCGAISSKMWDVKSFRSFCRSLSRKPQSPPGKSSWKGAKSYSVSGTGVQVVIASINLKPLFQTAAVTLEHKMLTQAKHCKAALA